MATLSTPQTLSSCGHPLDLSPGAFGELQDSSHLLDTPAALCRILAEEGYLFLRGYLDRDEVLAARRSVTDRLASDGLLHPDYPSIEAVAHPERRTAFKPDVAERNAEIQALLYGPTMLALYEGIFGKPVAHFDFTWFRAIGPGKGTTPHCDWPYMNRGSKNLLTAWVPYGEVTLDLGGLMILERSHLKADRLRNYLSLDVDTYCENRPREVEIAQEGRWVHNGQLSNNPVTLREKLGGRWLTAEFQPGDVLTFPMTLVHASLDNATDRIRMSSDTRYQPADEPRDERWIGPQPPGHSVAGKRGRVC